MTPRRFRELRASAAIAGSWQPILDECLDEIERLVAQKRKQAAPEGSQAIMEAWNSCGHLPIIRELSDSRKRTLSARLGEGFFVLNWKAAIGRACKSNFCRGKNERGWKADFDWFIKPGTVAKIMEGKYDNRDALPVAGKMNGGIGI